VRLVVSEANHHGIPVTVCGEVAADPRFVPLLLGLGVHELSVASRYLPTIKNAIRTMSIVSAAKLAEQALSLSSAAEIEQLINDEYRKNAPEDCFYNC
jgi:phosphotransferase system enzyme I (PtsI)